MTIPYIVKEEDRGQLQVQAVLVKHNRTHPFNQMIDVPFTNKMLDISLETFRQKITPGAEENWIIHVRAKEKEKVAAELLAAMYDASLDQFVPHNWQFNTLNRKASAPNWIFDNG
ncbi:hypothetical protein RZS08_29155, partial [Arthrospira platensis SPKY1]|nr:hypothetical protein [Arthrospira platensis SPKY1]